LTACGSSSSSSGGGGDGDTIKIAVFPALSGPNAASGASALHAAQLAVSEANAEGKVAGKKFKLVEVDTDGDPAKTQSLAERAVQRQGVHYLTGFINSNEALAVMPRLASWNAVLVSSSTASDDILNACNSRTFQSAQTNMQGVAAVSSYLKTLKVKKWSVVGSDTVTGRTSAADFVKQLKQSGARVATPEFVPAGNTDDGTIVSKVKAQGSDALFSSLNGSDSVTFLKQAKQFGLLSRFHYIAGQGFNRDTFWKAAGPSIAGTIGNIGWTAQLDTPLGKKFTKAYEDRFKTTPDYAAGTAYLAYSLLIKGIREAKTDNPKVVADKLHTLSSDSIVGHVAFRSDGLLQRPEYMGQVVKDTDGGFNKSGYKWKILKTFSAADTAPASPCKS
jgi:ABC-type branched-chain amino acid transport systems, periplasmic component